MKRYYIYQIPANNNSNSSSNPNGVEESSLPESYQPSQNCCNCAEYDAMEGMCALWNAPVDATYWCSSWHAIGELK